MFSEVFDHWSSYTSATANSVNLEASYSVASGSFSADFKHNKEKQIEDTAVTGPRVQIRHLFDVVKMHLESALHPVFKSRLMQIAAELQNNRTKQAWYSAQLLVREYGTHIITSVDAGAALVQESHIKESVINDKSLSAHDVKVAATSATFFKTLNIKAGFEHNASKENINKYENSQSASRILTYGGPAYRTNFSVQEWEEGLLRIGKRARGGDPLYYAITTATLPGFPEPTVYRLAKIVQRAVRLYYKANTVAGCTDATSPRFNFEANVDD